MKKLTLLGAVAFLFYGTTSFAQTSTLGNGALFQPQFLGFDGTGAPPKDLDIRNNFNRPINIFTNGIQRMVINGNKTASINGFTVNTFGFMGLGPNSVSPGHPNGLWNDFGPFSLLHLHGVTTPGEQVWPGGYRSWMKTGITFTDQIDMAYVGLRSVNVANNINEMVINWSNDPSVGQYGPDDMVFRFSAGTAATANGSASSDFSTNNDLDGLHIARFTGTGEFGLGPTFGVIQSHPLYVRPASIMHISRDKRKATWLQITNQNNTGQTAQDGLRFGIRNGLGASAYLRWQENTPFIIQTDWNTGAGGINNGERMRISSINAPGVPHPAGLANNTTRVAISHIGSQPITEPRSLLHLGYNTGGGFFNPTSVDGWRPWMDVGTYTNIGSDNMYVGLKREAGAFPANDRQDAVINWGDNGGNNPLNGPDNLRFIFTSTQTSTVPGNAPATGNDGLEVARMVPNKASTLTAPNYGMMGIGNFYNGGIQPVDAKLDIDGDLRIRQVTQDSTLMQVLVIDSNDLNRVHWMDVSNLGGNVTANNGVSTNVLGEIQLGVPCNVNGNPNIAGVNANSFTESRVVPNRNFDLWFASGNNETGGVGFGGQFIPIPFCGTGNTVEISANMKNTQYGNADASGLRFTKLISTSPTISNGVNGVNNTKVLTVDGDGDVVLTDAASGLGNYCGTTPINPLTSNYEINMNHNNMYFTNNGQIYMGDVSCGVNNLARLFVRNTFPSTTTSTGFWSESAGLPNQTAGFFNGSKYGVHANTGAGGFTGMSAAVYAVGATSGSGNSINSWAGYFNGDVFTTSSQYFASDNILKENISPINNALDKLRLIDAVTFNFKNSNFPSMNLPQGLEYGVIAQNVATVLPDLVKNITHPEELDSLGNVIHQSFQFEGVNYTELIPVLIAGVKELDSLNIYKDDIIKALDNRLSNLEDCLNKSGVCLTQNQKNENDNGNDGQTIELSNLNAIILDQNSPNPFAENTTITYVIPDDVMDAQLLFYDMNGRIIKQVDINERGQSQLTVYGNNLQKGIYTYSLIADGKLIATKKMVKQ